MMSFQAAPFLRLYLLFYLYFCTSLMRSDCMAIYEVVRTIQVVRASVIFVIALVAIYHSDNIYFDHKDCLY